MPDSSQIAVLVSIAIPIFTTQLEKSREATDEANIRSIYASLVADVLTEENIDKSDYNGAATYKVSKNTSTGVITGTATYKMKQQTNGLASGAASIEIGGQTINSGDFNTGTCTITVTSDGSLPTFIIA